MEFKWHFLKKSGIILAFFGFLREFLVALNASFTSTIEKGLAVPSPRGKTGGRERLRKADTNRVM